MVETESATDVLEPGIDFTAEALQQFMRMVEKRLAVPGTNEKAIQNDGGTTVVESFVLELTVPKPNLLTLYSMSLTTTSIMSRMARPGTVTMGR